MKLLILTQKVDSRDSVLGFFSRWIEELAKRVDSVTVIALGVGEYSLPSNVKVLSLGKESSGSLLKYVFRFYKYIWTERKNYDSVFIHMNQEYIILGWKLWFILGKKRFLWRNHPQGDLWTYLAALFSRKVFYTSPSSFTARFKKAVQMPVGIDTDFFKPDPNVERTHNSVLFLGRISPVKKVLEFVKEWGGTQYTVTIAGPILDADKEYGEAVLKNLPSNIKYVGPASREEARKLYQTHEIYVNRTPPGSFDKTIVEAAACGMKLDVDNLDAKRLISEDHSLGMLMEKLSREMS